MEGLAEEAEELIEEAKELIEDSPEKAEQLLAQANDKLGEVVNTLESLPDVVEDVVDGLAGLSLEGTDELFRHLREAITDFNIQLGDSTNSKENEKRENDEAIMLSLKEIEAMNLALDGSNTELYAYYDEIQIMDDESTFNENAERKNCFEKLHRKKRLLASLIKIYNTIDYGLSALEDPTVFEFLSSDFIDKKKDDLTRIALENKDLKGVENELRALADQYVTRHLDSIANRNKDIDALVMSTIALETETPNEHASLPQDKNYYISPYVPLEDHDYVIEQLEQFLNENPNVFVNVSYSQDLSIDNYHQRAQTGRPLNLGANYEYINIFYYNIPGSLGMGVTNNSTTPENITNQGLSIFTTDIESQFFYYQFLSAADNTESQIEAGNTEAQTEAENTEAQTEGEEEEPVIEKCTSRNVMLVSGDVYEIPSSLYEKIKDNLHIENNILKSFTLEGKKYVQVKTALIEYGVYKKSELSDLFVNMQGVLDDLNSATPTVKKVVYKDEKGEEHTTYRNIKKYTQALTKVIGCEGLKIQGDYQQCHDLAFLDCFTKEDRCDQFETVNNFPDDITKGIIEKVKQGYENSKANTTKMRQKGVFNHLVITDNSNTNIKSIADKLEMLEEKFFLLQAYHNTYMTAVFISDFPNNTKLSQDAANALSHEIRTEAGLDENAIVLLVSTSRYESVVGEDQTMICPTVGLSTTSEFSEKVTYEPEGRVDDILQTVLKIYAKVPKEAYLDYQYVVADGSIVIKRYYPKAKTTGLPFINNIELFISNNKKIIDDKRVKVGSAYRLFVDERLDGYTPDPYFGEEWEAYVKEKKELDEMIHRLYAEDLALIESGAAISQWERVEEEIGEFRETYMRDTSLVKSFLFKKMNFPCCLLYTSPSPRDGATSRMPSSA